uniref:SAM domain-containing protein n=1 Tax=Anopheles albimanus TaxID=7167 RepID=A0A182F164_ANOAL
MLVRCVKILVAVVLSLTFTISLSKLVLCFWNDWFNANAADYEILAPYPGGGRPGPFGPGAAHRRRASIVDDWLDQHQLGKYKRLFRDQGVAQDQVIAMLQEALSVPRLYHRVLVV